MKKTLYDLYAEAHAAAVTSLTATDDHAIETQMLASFNGGKNNAADFGWWKMQFFSIRANLVNLQKQPTPSVQAETAARARQAQAEAAAKITPPASSIVERLPGAVTAVGPPAKN